MTIILSEADAARLGVPDAKPRRKASHARNARPDIPRAAAGEGDRHAALMRLARFGFWPRYDAGLGYSFWHLDGRTTTRHDNYAAAVIAAEREVVNHG